MSKIDLSRVVDVAVTAGLNAAAASRDNDLKRTDVGAVAATVAAAARPAIEREVEARIDNATNAEPLYRSRVMIGLAVTVVAQVANYFGHDIVPAAQVELVELVLQTVSFVGAAYAAYGRIRGAQLKPVGS